MQRRSFLVLAAGALQAAELIIDIHQHTDYSGRSDEELIAHQRRIGITRTILLPAGSKYGLAAGSGGNESVLRLARAYPRLFSFFANEAPDLPQARQEIEKYLRLGAIGIGEQKFPLDSDSPQVELVASIARDYRVPVLLHFEHNTYNYAFNRFYRVLERFPSVNFIGHAQTFWGNIDKDHRQEILYPKQKVTPGGITDRYLTDYKNMYGDLSAGSGLNALLRDEDHARAFLERHQDKLLYGSDCSDRNTGACSGEQQIATVRRLAEPRVQRKILYENSRRLFRL